MSEPTPLPRRSMPVTWGRPLPPGEDRERWIACVMDMQDIADREVRPPLRPDYLTAHWVFCRKVLRESKADAMSLAAAFRNACLTPDVCKGMADDWWEPTTAEAA